MFPVDSQAMNRDHDEYKQCLRVSKRSGKAYKGIKGKTLLSSVLTIPENVVFDPMHLLYLGINKAMLNLIIDRRLISMDKLSDILESIRVPHYFRRKPRSFSELSLWKAQEHRNFLIYFAPYVLFCAQQRMVSADPYIMFIMYTLLSTSVYLLSQENVSTPDIDIASTLIHVFQTRLIRVFGPSVQTITLHALKHLPQQVRHFGSLAYVSASSFEAVNRQLKLSVTGTRGHGNQLVSRFLNFQNTKPKSSNLAFPLELGLRTPFYSKAQPQFTHTLNRFQNGDLIFHSFAYDTNLKCASHWAFIDEKQCFVCIRQIFLDNEANIVCLCNVFTILGRFPAYNKQLPLSVHDIISTISPYFSLSLDLKNNEYILGKCFSHHALIFKLSEDLYYGVKILNTFEHE